MTDAEKIIDLERRVAELEREVKGFWDRPVDGGTKHWCEHLSDRPVPFPELRKYEARCNNLYSMTSVFDHLPPANPHRVTLADATD